MNLQQRNTLSGFLYLSLVVLGPIGFLFLPSLFADASNVSVYVQDNPGLVALWLLVDLLIIAVEIVLTIQLFHIFKGYHHRLSQFAFGFRMAMTAIMVVNAFVLVLLLMDGGTAAERYVDFHGTLVYVWQLFFAPHVFLIGLVFVRFIPNQWNILGYALILGAVGYFLDSINVLLFSNQTILANVSAVLLVFVMIGEIGLAILLLLRRIVSNPEVQA